MSHARSSSDRRGTGRKSGTDSERSPAAKVLLMELARAGRPLAAEELCERTLLSMDAVESTLPMLVDSGLCSEQPGDDRRPTRFDVELPPAIETAD